MPVPKKPDEKLQQSVVLMDAADFTRLQQAAQQDKADLQAMFDLVDNHYKEQEQ